MSNIVTFEYDSLKDRGKTDGFIYLSKNPVVVIKDGENNISEHQYQAIKGLPKFKKMLKDKIIVMKSMDRTKRQTSETLVPTPVPTPTNVLSSPPSKKEKAK